MDAVYSSKRVDDRRMWINTAVLQYMLKKSEINRVSWVNTSQQLDDCLTQRGASTEQLRAAISRE